MHLSDIFRPWKVQIARVAQVMDEVLARAKRAGPCCARRRLDLTSDRYIIFSDLHRGIRNASDDFRNNERAYNAALAYYYRMGHTLIVLGDAEELWEERPEPVLATYRHSIELEKRFHQAGRYVRIWGNHDDLWQFKDRVAELLAPLYGDPPLEVYEALLLEVMEDGTPLGNLFCVHGHQGDRKSSQWSWFTRYIVRFFWRPLQRLLKISIETPAQDWCLEHRLHRALYAWAKHQQNLILITGHVHAPVFESYSLEARIKAELARLQEEAGEVATPAQIEAQALALARLEWVRVKEAKHRRQSIQSDVAFEKPWYFGTGCACYSDGEITGIEINRGEIRLIRWPDESGEPRPHILAHDSLRKLLHP